MNKLLKVYAFFIIMYVIGVALNFDGFFIALILGAVFTYLVKRMASSR